jgi:membrane associated rhomboid family serine protease
MIPLWDDNSQERTKPFVNYTLIIVNLLVFFRQLADPNPAQFIREWAVIPSQINTMHHWENLLSSIFMHGGWMHLLGNMLFLWVFGDNVEDRVGHKHYAMFYLACGIAASFAQVMVAPESTMPLLGASGAISGVLAAYLIMFPRNHVKVLVFARFLTEMPAYVMIGVWGAIQLVSGAVMASHMATHGGTAYGAHIGGFAAGALLTAVMPKQPIPAALPAPPPPPKANATAAASSPTAAQPDN